MTFFQTFSTEPQVVSTSVQPCAAELRHLVDGDAERRQDHHVVRRRASRALARVDRKRMPLRAQPLVDVRVVDDLAGQEDVPAGKPPPRLIGVIDRAIDAVTEAEFAGEMDGQPAGT